METKRINFVVILLVCFVSCKDQPLSYLVQGEEEAIVGEVWKKADGVSLYTDLKITDSYYVFLDYRSDSILQVYTKDDPLKPVVYGIKDEKEKRFSSVEFTKSNTRYTSGNEDVWIVDDKKMLTQIRCRKDSLEVVQDIPLPENLGRSIEYNIGKEEIYGILSSGKKGNAYYLFRPDSGYYWVSAYKGPKIYRKNDFAFSANLIVNEKANSTVCAYRFFNKVQFFDLKDNIVRDVMYGDERIEPKDIVVSTFNFTENRKCFIDICGTDQYVYCVYDGSYDYSQLSKIMIFKWDGTHIKTLQTDRKIKKIAIEKSDSYLMAIAADEHGGRDVVRYSLKGL